MNRRVLVTGSRQWPVPLIYMVHGILNAELRRCSPGDKLTVVHGGCPSGADWFAHRWAAAELVGNPLRQVLAGGVVVREEIHEAQWDRVCDHNCYHRAKWRDGKLYCPMAGHVRNQEMVNAGADICHAFVVVGTNLSRGTFDCVGRAEEAGIPVIQHRVAANLFPEPKPPNMKGM